MQIAKNPNLFDQCCQSATAMCVVLALLTVVFGPTEMTSMGLQLRVLYAGGCLLACIGLSGVTLARYFSRRRALVRLLELRYA